MCQQMYIKMANTQQIQAKEPLLVTEPQFEFAWLKNKHNIKCLHPVFSFLVLILEPKLWGS